MTIAGVGDDACHAPSFDDKIVDRGLEDVEARLSEHQRLDRRAIQRAVGLRPRGAHGRSFRGVEGTKLDARAIDGPGHCATERVDLPRQVTLADAADGRVAAHLPERRDLVRDQQRAGTGARGSQAGLRTGVTASDHYDVIRSRHWLKNSHFRVARDSSRWAGPLPPELY